MQKHRSINTEETKELKHISRNTGAETQEQKRRSRSRSSNIVAESLMRLHASDRALRL